MRKGEKEVALGRKYAHDMGIPEDRFWIEDQSRTTWESADAVYRVLEDRFPNRSHRVLLVTSAWHMPRAVALFRRRGFMVLPAPTDRTFSGAESVDLLSVLPDSGQFSSSVLGLHEWIGRGGYWIREQVSGRR